MTKYVIEIECRALADARIEVLVHQVTELLRDWDVKPARVEMRKPGEPSVFEQDDEQESGIVAAERATTLAHRDRLVECLIRREGVSEFGAVSIYAAVDALMAQRAKRMQQS